MARMIQLAKARMFLKEVEMLQNFSQVLIDILEGKIKEEQISDLVDGYLINSEEILKEARLLINNEVEDTVLSKRIKEDNNESN